MNYTQLNQELERAKAYLVRAKKLENILDNEEAEAASIASSFLQEEVEKYERDISREKEYLAKRSQEEGELARTIQAYSDLLGINYNQAIEDLERQKEKSCDEQRREARKIRTCFCILSCLLENKDIEASESYRNTYQTYGRIIDLINETEQIQIENQKRSLIREKEEAKFYETLIHLGIEKVAAEKISLNPNLFMYGIVETLENRYDMD